MKTIVLFDLGQTLADYFGRAEFQAILAEAIGAVSDYLRQEGLLRLPAEAIWSSVLDENHEAEDHRVRPLEERLRRIYRLEPGECADHMSTMCRRFLAPVFRRGRLYEDALPTLSELRSGGLRTGIVSNSPWGSPASLWREEVGRLGLTPHVDVLVFCGEAGWRKPAQPIFDLALARLGARAEECLFVGDDPRWDLPGPRAMGMEAVLIDRKGTQQATGERPIRNLGELLERLRSDNERHLTLRLS
jgi:putative hydrolase of the HAD superfamily